MSEQVLQYWQRELLCNHSESSTLDVWSKEGAKVRELVTVAVRLRQGKVAAVLPEEVGQSLSAQDTALMQAACISRRVPLAHGGLTGLLQVLALLMTFYRTLPGLEDKTRFFHLLCRDFGTQRALRPQH